MTTITLFVKMARCLEYVSGGGCDAVGSGSDSESCSDVSVCSEGSVTYSTPPPKRKKPSSEPHPIQSNNVESPEYRTIVSCTKQLETALRSLNRDTVHFLHRDGFITDEVHTEILKPGSVWTVYQKAGELMFGIRNMVKLCSLHYYTFLGHLRQGGNQYKSLVKILDKEYCRQNKEASNCSINSSPLLSSSLLRYRNYLKSYYSLNSLPCDDKLFISPCSQFISLAVVKRGKKSFDTFSQSTFHGGVDEIVASKDPCDIDSLVTADSMFVLVEGPPGIGKSTLCWELCRKWDTLDSLKRFKVVLQLKLREKRVQSAQNLTDIFFHLDSKLSQSVVEEVLECEGEGVLFILDGFDEMPSQLVNSNNSLIIQLLNGIFLPKASRLVTSRPSALYHKDIFPRDYKHVEILGFTDEHKVKFAEFTFQSEPNVLHHFKDFIFSNPIIKSLMYIPINCAIIAQVYKDIRSCSWLIPKTMTQLYTTLVLVLIRRHMIGERKWSKDSNLPNSLENLPHEISSNLQKVSELAYRGLMKKDVQLSFTESDAGEGFQHLGLLSEAKEMYVEGAKSSYTFLHLSMQEFLAAWYCRHSSCIDIQSLGLTSWLKFVAGFLGEKFLMYTLMEKDPNFLVHCLYEAQCACNQLKASEFKNTLGYTSRTPLDMYMFGYVLAHAPIMWNLTLAVNSDVSQLINGCVGSKKMLGNIVTLRILGCLSVNSFVELPACLAGQITSISIGSLVSLPTKWLSSLCNLRCMHLFTNYFEHSLSWMPRFLQTLDVTCGYNVQPRHLHNMKLLLSNREIHTVIIMESVRSVLPSKNSGVVEAALSCPTVRKLRTNIPFSNIKKVTSLESIEFISENLTQHEHSLYCIANLCSMPSMRFLKVEEMINPFEKLFYFASLNTFLVDLNLSLSINRSFAELELSPAVWYCISNLSKSLKTHPSLSSSKRSKSLNNLQKELRKELFVRHDAQSVSVSPSSMCVFWKSCLPVQRIGEKCVSCPDQSQIQSLHDMHPLLHKAMHTDKLLYYNKSEQKRNISNNCGDDS